MTLKKLLAAGLCLLLLAGCGAKPAPEPPAPQQDNAAEAPETEMPAPEALPEPTYLGDFEAETLTGETLTQDFFADAKLTLINVWGTYCGPCKEEMPVLGKLDRELEDVQVLGIVIDATKQSGKPDPDQVELALALAEASEADYPTLILNQSLAKLGFAGFEGVPATVFVDQEGYLVGAGFYGALDEDNWRTVIAERLEMAS